MRRPLVSAREMDGACAPIFSVMRSDLRFDLPVLDAHVVDRHPRRGVDRRLAGADVETPAVPRAGDDALLVDAALAEGPAAVRAEAVDDIDFPAVVEGG